MRVCLLLIPVQFFIAPLERTWCNLTALVVARQQPFAKSQLSTFPLFNEWWWPPRHWISAAFIRPWPLPQNSEQAIS
jgi:hypothetical protein